MSVKMRPVGHKDQLSLVEHLDELRTRLIICVITFVVAFALCFWQNDLLLDVINKPLQQVTQNSDKPTAAGLEHNSVFQTRLRSALDQTSTALERLSASPSTTTPDKRALQDAARGLQSAASSLPKDVPPRQPVTLGVGEPFMTTLTVAAYFALLLSLPLILYQLYSFVLPAFTPSERRVALPLMLMVPVLFIVGVLFGYFVVLPPAISFLQTFNDNQFDILLQARDYYRFAVLALVAMGILFQIPIGVLAATRLGIVTPRQLRRNRRYAILVIAVLAMLLPGTDPVTMLIAMVPLAILYEGSILLAVVFDRRARAAHSTELASTESE